MLHRAKAPDMVSAAEALLLTRLRRVADGLRSGSLCAEPRLGCVGPRETLLLRAVADLALATVSWSNLMDFIPLRTFHQLARGYINYKWISM